MSRSRVGSGIARNFVSHSRSARDDCVVKPRSGVGFGAAGTNASVPRAMTTEMRGRMDLSWRAHTRVASLGGRPAGRPARTVRCGVVGDIHGALSTARLVADRLRPIGLSAGMLVGDLLPAVLSRRYDSDGLEELR